MKEFIQIYSRVAMPVFFIIFFFVGIYIISEKNEQKHHNYYPEIYTERQLKSIKAGDTIYVRACGDLFKAKAVCNDTVLHIITLKRANYYEARRNNYWMEETRTWSEISGNK